MRSWNIAVPAALLACTACGIPAIDDATPVETGEESSSSDSDATTTSESETTGEPPETETGDGQEPECTSDLDCDPGEACISGQCGSNDGYVPPPPDECDNSVDCPGGQACFETYWDWDHTFNDCYAVRELADCEAPVLVEIPLPPEAGDAIDLQFADVDGDGFDELVVLTEQELQVFDEGQLSSSTPLPPHQNTELELMHVNEDGQLDVVMTSDQTSQSFIALGLGAGSFAAPIAGPDDELADSFSLDWIPGGPDELIARAGALINIYPDLLTPMADHEQLWANAKRLTAGVTDDDEPRIAVIEPGKLDNFGRVTTHRPPDVSSDWPLEYRGLGDQPNLAYGQFSKNVVDLIVIDAYPEGTLVTGPGGVWYAWTEASELITLDPFAAGSDSVLLFNPGPPTLLFEDSDKNEAIGCQATLDVLPPTMVRAAVGDIDGDGFPELAGIDSGGELGLWSTTPG
ncbi:hypothetical protein [Enhygromyxa salina]|uniref:hypothetical protein n=1 Tax=Enhygromyxa salina TaxID=215803 RepID=UPI0011BA7B2A|nr:hypothetical protein [Enhygromyxa salina]